MSRRLVEYCRESRRFAVRRAVVPVMILTGVAIAAVQAGPGIRAQGSGVVKCPSVPPALGRPNQDGEYRKLDEKRMFSGDPSSLRACFYGA